MNSYDERSENGDVQRTMQEKDLNNASPKPRVLWIRPKFIGGACISFSKLFRLAKVEVGFAFARLATEFDGCCP